jgi:hypothetical protein
MSLRLEVKLKLTIGARKFLLGVDWLNLTADWPDERSWPPSAKTANRVITALIMRDATVPVTSLLFYIIYIVFERL